MVFAGQALKASISIADPVSSIRYLESEGDNVVVKTHSGNIKLVLNSDSSLVDTVSQKYFTIGSDGFVTLSNSKQEGYTVESPFLVFSKDIYFSEVDGRLVFDFNRRFSAYDSFAVIIGNTTDVPDVIP